MKNWVVTASRKTSFHLSHKNDDYKGQYLLSLVPYLYPVLAKMLCVLWLCVYGRRTPTREITIDIIICSRLVTKNVLMKSSIS